MNYSKSSFCFGEICFLECLKYDSSFCKEVEGFNYEKKVRL